MRRRSYATATTRVASRFVPGRGIDFVVRLLRLHPTGDLLDQQSDLVAQAVPRAARRPPTMAELRWWWMFCAMRSEVPLAARVHEVALVVGLVGRERDSSSLAVLALFLALPASPLTGCALPPFAFLIEHGE